MREHVKYFKSFTKKCKKGSYLASSVIALEAYVHNFLKIHQKIERFIAPSIFLRNKFNVEVGLNMGI